MIYLATPLSSQTNFITIVPNLVDATPMSTHAAAATSPRPVPAAVTGYARPAQTRSTSPRPGQAAVAGYTRPSQALPEFRQPRANTTSTDQRRPQDLPSVMRGKPPVWKAFSNPVKRGPRTPSTEPVIKCSRNDAAENFTYDRILSNIRILIQRLQFYSLHYQAASVRQLEGEFRLDAAHSEQALYCIQKDLLEECRARLVEVEVDWKELPLFKNMDWSVA